MHGGVGRVSVCESGNSSGRALVEAPGSQDFDSDGALSFMLRHLPRILSSPLKLGSEAFEILHYCLQLIFCESCYHHGITVKLLMPL